MKTTMTKEEKEKEAFRTRAHQLFRDKHCSGCQIAYTKDAIEVLSVSKEAAVVKIKCTKCGIKLGIAMVGRYA